MTNRPASISSRRALTNRCRHSSPPPGAPSSFFVLAVVLCSVVDVIWELAS